MEPNPNSPANSEAGASPDSPNGRPALASRREFLKTAGAGAAGIVLSSAIAATPALAEAGYGRANTNKLTGNVKPMVPMATGRVIGANDRILLGHVGIGGRGSDHLASTLGIQDTPEYNTRSIGVSDCWSKRRDDAKNAILKANADAKVQSEDDYRRLLDNKDIDAIIIATPEHWHAQVAIDAMQAGKHVYIEKPMSRYLNEAFAVYDTQQRTGRVVQVGSQGCSDAKWWTAGKAVRDGKVGHPVSAQGSYCRNSTDGEWNYYIDPSANPTNLDWEMWLGTAPDRPWSDDARARFFRYRKYRDYSAGLLGDLLPHKVLPLMIAMMYDKPEFPLRVTALGTRAVSTDREVADTIHIVTEFPAGFTMYFLLSTVNEQGVDDMIRGHKASLYFGGDKVHLKPERPYAEDVDEADIPVVGPGEDTNVHRADWLKAIRTGKKPNCDIDLATKAQVVISLAEMSELHNRTMCFDASRREIIKDLPNEYEHAIPQAPDVKKA